MSDKQLSIHLTIAEDLHSSVKERAFEERTSIVGLTRKALREHLVRAEAYDPLTPKGYFSLEAYQNDEGKVVLLGDPKHDPDHNCDQRGCGSIGNHVICWTSFKEIQSIIEVSES